MIMALWFMMIMLSLTCLMLIGIYPATLWDVSVIALITALMCSICLCYFARPTSSPKPLSQPMPLSPPPPSPSPAVAVPPVAAGTVGSTSANPELMAAESLSVDAPAVADAPTAANQAEESILQDLRQFFSSIAMAVWLPCKNAYRVFKRLCVVIYRIATKYAPRSTLAVCVVVAMFGFVSHMRNWSAVSTIVQSAVKASWTPICDPGFVISDVRHNDFPYCEACPRGRHPADQRKKCVKCKPGSYAQTAGLAQCSDCEPGKFAQNEGAHVCTMCPKGHFAPTGAASCSPCPSGRYAPHTGQGPQCIACAAGTFASETGTTACEACRPGKYAPRVAMASCDFCPHGEIAEAAGALACTRGISIPERGLFETVRDSLNEFVRESIVAWLQALYDSLFSRSAEEFEAKYWEYFTQKAPPKAEDAKVEEAKTEHELCSTSFHTEIKCIVRGKPCTTRVLPESRHVLTLLAREDKAFTELQERAKASNTKEKRKCKSLSRKCSFYIHPDKLARNFNCVNQAHAFELGGNLTQWLNQ